MGTLNRVMKKYHLTRWFKRKNLVVLVLTGVLLVIITFPIKNDNKQNTKSDIQREGVVRVSDMSTDRIQYEETYEYADYLERELEEILSKMKGVGNVKVMITMEGSKELIVHQDEKFSSSDSSETDSKGGNRIVNQTDMQGQTIFEKTDTGESPYVVQTKLPKVSGVLIVAEGAGDGSVRKSITEIAEALLDVAVHKVTVVAME